MALHQLGENLRGFPKDFPWEKNITRITNAVRCHSGLSGSKDGQEFRFSIVGIVISV